MLKNRRQKAMTWMTIFVMLFSVIAPTSTAWAQTPEVVDDPVEVIGNEDEVGVEPNDPTPTPEDPIPTPEDPTATPLAEDGDEEPLGGSAVIMDTPPDFDATVEVEGIDEFGMIAHGDTIKVTVTLDPIPVKGDGGDEGDYFKHGDTVTLLLSEHFKFDPIPSNQVLMFNGVKVGTVVYSNNDDGQAIATIVFDGEPYIFDPEHEDLVGSPYSGVSAEFTFDLVWNGKNEKDDNGDEFVVILDKTYELQVPGDIHTYSVTKDVASTNLEDGTITWSVTITGESDTDPVTHLGLAGFLFSDDLSTVGDYVVGSFTASDSVGPLSLATLTSAGSELTYILPDSSVSPVVITFKTSIPDATLTDGGTISNTAEVFDGEDSIGSDDASTTIVGPSASKTGVADDGFGEGTYDPTDRTITWTVTVDNKGQTLNGLKITDVLQGGLTFESAVWQRWDEASQSWVDVKTWTSEPTGGVYEIGDVDYVGRLVIISNVPNEDEDGSVAAKTYNNQASASWVSPGGSTGNAGTGNPGVGIGYNAITKSGTQSETDKANHQISWTINVDLRGQTTTDFVYYDLFVHDAATAASALTGAAGWPAGLLVGSNGVNRNNGQKFIGVTSQDSHLDVEVINLVIAGNVVGTLVKVTGLRANGSNQVVLKSQVIDPNVLAGNSSSQTVANTASLYKGTTYRGKDSDSVPFANMILAKQMLNRAEVANDHDPLATINPNNSTTGLSNGFHYDHKEVIFRLNINGAGLDFADVDTNLPGGFGDVTVTDTLPSGWVFTPFSGGAEYLIYSANGTYVATLPALNPADITGFTAAFEPATADDPAKATFTFTDLDQPYVILVKARPTDATFDGYLLGANSHTETNTLNLSTENWTPGKTVTQQVTVDPQIIGKGVDFTLAETQDQLTWSVDYTPFNPPIDSPITTATDLYILDTLPEGIDLRLDSSGEIIWGPNDNRNITVFELIPNGTGDGIVKNSYTSIPLSQKAMEEAVKYDNATRTLKFTFPLPDDPTDTPKAYRLVYITDITNQFPIGAKVENNASLVGVTGEGTSTGAGYGVTSQHGSAIMGRSGFVHLIKTDGNGKVLPGVEFTLYNTDPDDGSIGSVKAVRTVGADGVIRIYGLSTGTYILIETKVLDGYYNPYQQYKVVVDENLLTTIVELGKDMSTQTPVEIKNYEEATEQGSLTISKTVAGNAGDTDKLFAFTVTFVGAPNRYPFIGSGGAGDGTIESGETIYLKHGQSITINGLPKDATYTVKEGDYTEQGYEEVPDATGTIVVDETQVAAFTNTRNVGFLTISKTVEGNGGDPDKLFSFTVTFENAPDEYPYVGAGGAANGTIKSGDTIQLAHGQSITIHELPKDATYTVVEADYSADGYILTYTGAEGNFEIDFEQVAAFTNIREIGTLTISKLVEGNGGDLTKLFAFTVTFENAPYTYPYVGLGGAADGTIKSGDTIQLAHGQSITINDLPKGATYTVVEADYSADGYILTYTGANGIIDIDEAQVARFTNTRDIGSLTISKTVAGNGGDHSKVFAFTVTFENAPYTYPYLGSGGAADGTIESGDTIYLSHGQSITINDLPKDATYTVVEEDYSADGYRLTHTGSNGTIVVDETQVAAFTNTREVGELIIKKTVTGDLGDKNRYFTFLVEFENDNDRTYQYHGSKSGSIKSGETILLKHDEYVVIEDILIGTSFKVTEVEAYQNGYGTSFTGTEGIMDTEGKTAAFVNWRSSVPNTGDDNTASIGRLGLMVSIPLLLLSSGTYGVLEAKKRKKNLS